MENDILDYLIVKPEGILVLKPHGPLSKENFHGLRAAVGSYLSEHLKLNGVLVHSKGFPGWESFGRFTAHIHFVRDHHEKINQVAVTTDSQFAEIAASLSKHCTSAEIKHVPFSEDVSALDWLQNA